MEGIIPVNNFKISILTILLVLSVFPGLLMSATYEYGNTPGNSLNGSWVVKKDSWIYFIGLNNYIYKMSQDGKQKSIVYKDSLVDTIFLINNWIYFPGMVTETGEGERGIFRISIDGKNKEKVTDKNCELVNITNNYLFYYKTYKDLCFYRRNLADSNELMLSKTQIRKFCIIGDDIFYLDDFSLIKAKNDGSEKIKLAKNVFEFGVADGYVYFIDGKPDHHSIKSIAIDGSNLKELKKDGIYDQIFVENGWIYYTGENIFCNKEIPLTKMKIDGTEEKQIFNGHVAKINIIDDWMYFYYYDSQEGAKIYKMKTDGTQLQVLDEL